MAMFLIITSRERESYTVFALDKCLTYEETTQFDFNLFIISSWYVREQLPNSALLMHGKVPGILSSR